MRMQRLLFDCIRVDHPRGFRISAFGLGNDCSSPVTPEGQVFRLRTVAAPIINNTPVKARMVKSSSANRIEPVPARIIITIATTLVLRLIQRLSSQFLRIGPNRLLLSNHLCHFSDDLAKNQADSNRKGVDGRTGSTAPKIASPRNRNPRGL
jgi:hypothetical protein